ncbi:unnamed protein product [Urochloa humidicola]
MDCEMEKPQEEECLRMWIWTSNPDGIATIATLQIEEPVTLPEESYADSSMELDMPKGVLRIGPAETMDYDVTIHVDRVLDYTMPAPSPSHRYSDSLISGYLDDEVQESWPERHPFAWKLGVPDDHFEPVPQRLSVHDRLGPRGRDRSPPHGGSSGGGLGLRQFPPSGIHDLRGNLGGSGFYYGSSSRYGEGVGNSGGHDGRRRTAGHGRGEHMVQVWRPRQAQPEGKDCTVPEIAIENSFQPRVSTDQRQWAVDPMEEEANRMHCPSMVQFARLHRSVEPTATIADSAGLVLVDGNEAPIGLTTDRGVPTTANEAAVHETIEHAGLLTEEQQTREMGSKDHEQKEQQVLQEKLTGVELRPTLQHTMGQLAQEDSLLREPDFTTVLDQLHVSEQEALDAHEARTKDGPRFDLNLRCDAPDEPSNQNAAQEEDHCAERVVLRTAEERLNKESMEHGSQRMGLRGAFRYPVPLKKSLLCNPMHKPKSTNAKKHGCTDRTVENEPSHGGNTERCNIKMCSKRNQGRPVEEQANELLLRTTGILGEQEPVTEKAQDQFGEQFVTPMNYDFAGDIRIALGMPDVGGVGALDSLALEAAE